LHQLWPPSGDNRNTKCDVVFFHGLQLTADYIDDAWRNTWTQRGNEKVCWPEEWLPSDLGEDVRIFSFSYNAHVVTSPHDHVSEVAHNLFQTLMDRRYESLVFDYQHRLLGPMYIQLQMFKFSEMRFCSPTGGLSLICIEFL
jgi:hypothetical protein